MYFLPCVNAYLVWEWLPTTFTRHSELISLLLHLKVFLSVVSGLLALRPYLIADFSASLQNQIVVVSKRSIPRSPTKGRLDSARLLTVLSIALAISPYLIWRKQKCLVLTLCIRTRQCISLYNQENSCQNVSVVALPARYTTSLGRKVIRLHRVMLNNKYNLL